MSITPVSTIRGITGDGTATGTLGITAPTPGTTLGITAPTPGTTLGIGTAGTVAGMTRGTIRAGILHGTIPPGTAMAIHTGTATPTAVTHGTITTAIREA